MYKSCPSRTRFSPGAGHHLEKHPLEPLHQGPGGSVLGIRKRYLEYSLNGIGYVVGIRAKDIVWGGPGSV